MGSEMCIRDSAEGRSHARAGTNEAAQAAERAGLATAVRRPPHAAGELVEICERSVLERGAREVARDEDRNVANRVERPLVLDAVFGPVLLGEQSASKTDGLGSNPGGPAELEMPAWQNGDAAVL